MTGEIQLSLPEFYQLESIYTTLLDKFNGLFLPQRKIAKVFGCFPNMCWNGGNLKISYRDVSLDEVEKCLRTYLQRGVRVSLVASNCLLDQKPYLVNDGYCNKVIDVMQRLSREFEARLPTPFSCNIVSHALAKYLKSVFPSLKLCWSNLSEESKSSDPDSLEEDVILDESRNYDFQFLQSISRKDKIEFVSTSCCKPWCQFKREHCKIVSEAQIQGKKLKFNDCLAEHDKNLEREFLTDATMIPSNDLDHWTCLGFNRFKVTSRKIDDQWDLEFTLNNICKWLIKPSFQRVVLEALKKEEIIWL